MQQGKRVLQLDYRRLGKKQGERIKNFGWLVRRDLSQKMGRGNQENKGGAKLQLEKKQFINEAKRSAEITNRKASGEFVEFLDLNEKGKPKKTILNFKAVLFFYGISLKYDTVKREIIYSIRDKEVSGALGSIHHFDEFVTYVLDICSVEGFPAKRDDIFNWLYYIANEGRFNHLKNCFEEYYGKYKGMTGEFEKFINCISFQGNADFSRLLYMKALWQSVAMIHNENGSYGADGALALQGCQGIGKTSIVRKPCECFGLKYFKESAQFSKFSRKDDIIENTSVFICELGEGRKSIDDVDWMKRFITNPIDEVRIPYARTAKKYPRRTTFYLTVNDMEYLKDMENRRYWTISIKDIDLNALNEINYEKMWSEVFSWYLANPVGFRLTESERAKLQKINKPFRQMSLEERVLSDALDWEQPEGDWKEKTATQIATEISEQTNQKISPQKVGTALKSLGYDREADVKTYRILDGKSVYNVPDVINGIQTGNPFDPTMNGKVVGIFKSSGASGAKGGRTL